MSVIVVLNSVEFLVDLMRFPGQLVRRSTKAIFMCHISAAGESDSAENDSCDSPLEPNSPLYGFSERLDPDRWACNGCTYLNCVWLSYFVAYDHTVFVRNMLHKVFHWKLFIFLFINCVTSTEKDENLQFRRFDSNVPGPSLRNMMLRTTTAAERKLR